MTPQDLLSPNAPTVVDENQTTNAVINLDQNIEVEDSTADSNIPPRPPEKGAYPFAWKLNTDKGGGQIGNFDIPKGISVGVAGKDNNPFVGLYLLGNLRDESNDYNGFMVNYYCNTLKFGGKSTSDLHSFMHKIGCTLSNSASIREIVTAIKDAFDGSEPVSLADVDWRGSYENPNPITDRNDKKFGKDKYVEQYKTMTDFPKNADGSYNNVGVSKKDGEPLYAQAFVKRIV